MTQANCANTSKIERDMYGEDGLFYAKMTLKMQPKPKRNEVRRNGESSTKKRIKKEERKRGCSNFVKLEDKPLTKR